jgi:hypothetical protein
VGVVEKNSLKQSVACIRVMKHETTNKKSKYTGEEKYISTCTCRRRVVVVVECGSGRYTFFVVKKKITKKQIPFLIQNLPTVKSRSSM